MGPQRIFDRVVGLPKFVARLPRTAFDLARGKTPAAGDAAPDQPTVPDFRGELVDAYASFTARVGDVLAAHDLPAEGDWRLPGEPAAEAADEVLGDFRRWLEARWDKTPRDTRAIEWLAKRVPGGQKAVKLTETAPYLLVAASAATSFVTAGAEQVVIGGYLLTTWLGEKLSDEVAAETRRTNTRLAASFADVCERQATAAAAWAMRQAPSPEAVAELADAVDDVARRAGVSK
jgi:hypothetical protein